ncbi:MAG: MerR family transcriptional regulator [Gemmataceae bacterium]|nr:MerR family transcriptional regulator [Gemmataceae bacterium]
MIEPSENLWTIDELATQVARALSIDYQGQASGRVRDVPNQRAIRYYTTLGLIDRPAEMRGRVALYSRRHLLQLVAIKRLQAGGLTLGEMQRRLVGLSEAELARLARLPADRPAPLPPTPSPDRGGGESVAGNADTRSADFWRSEPAEPLSEQQEANGAAPTVAADEDRPLQGIRLAGEVALLFPSAGPLTPDDIEAIRAAAGPLLELLQTRLRPPHERRRP